MSENIMITGKTFEPTMMFKDMANYIFNASDNLNVIMINRTGEILAFEEITYCINGYTNTITAADSRDDIILLANNINRLDWIVINAWVKDDIISHRFTNTEIVNLGGLKLLCLVELCQAYFKEVVYNSLYNMDEIHRSRLEIFHKNPLLEASIDIANALTINTSNSMTNIIKSMLGAKPLPLEISEVWNYHLQSIRALSSKNPYHPVVVITHVMGIEVVLYEDIRVFRYNELNHAKRLEEELSREESKEEISITDAMLGDSSMLGNNSDYFLRDGT